MWRQGFPAHRLDELWEREAHPLLLFVGEEAVVEEGDATGEHGDVETLFLFKIFNELLEGECAGNIESVPDLVHILKLAH